MERVLAVDELLGHRDLGDLEQVLDQLVAGLRALLQGLHPGQPGADVGAQLLEGVELAGRRGELVVELGELLGLDRPHGDLHVSHLAGVLAVEQGGGEGGALVDGQAAHGLVQTVHQLAGADLVGHAGGGAVLQHLPVQRGLQVDGDVVAVGGRTVDPGEHGEALTHGVDLLGDLLVGDLDVVDGDREPVQRRQRQLGSDVDLGGERQRLAVVQAGDLDVGLAQHPHLVLAHGLGIDLRDGVLDDLLEDDGTTDPLVEDAVGHLAGAEARHADLLAQLLVDLTEGVVQVAPRHLDREPDPGRAQVLDGALHSAALLLGTDGGT
jgi:hypothetical protein